MFVGRAEDNDAFVIPAASRFAIDPDASRPICEQADARNDQVSHTAQSKGAHLMPQRLSVGVK
jgi:hypothetical protein